MTDPAAALRVRAQRPVGNRLEVELDSCWGRGTFSTPLLGDFLLSNLLGSVTLLAGLGLPFDAVLEAAGRVRPVMGRLQPFTHPDGFTVVVDYAHTPDALAQALRVLRGHFPGRLHCVFGCGGERDPGKRALMGGAAASLADRLLVTDDNCGETVTRSSPGSSRAPSNRRRSARPSSPSLRPSPVRSPVTLSLSRKGHEDYQEGPDGRVPYSDVALVEALVADAVAREQEVNACSCG